MKAVTLIEYGDVEVLQLSSVEKPTPADDQVLVRVHATALNRADILQRRGKYPPPKGDSDILGLEIAGDVCAWGKNVNGFTLGQRVFGLVGGGGYAEYCLIDSAMAMPIPEKWDYVQAAAVPEAFFTANETLFELGELKSNESILIHAGASGVGIAAIQMAHHIGAKVYFTAGSAEKISKVMSLGALAGINYKTQDFSLEIMGLTQEQGVDVIEDFNGADYFARNLQILKPGGRLICVAFMGGTKAEIDLKLIQGKRLQIKGTALRTRSLEDKRLISKRFATRWLPILKSGEITPVIDSIFPLEEIQKAHARMEANLNMGKIVIRIS